MKWVTRRGVHIDRAASAWLIRRFIYRLYEFFHRELLLGRTPG